MLTTPCRQGVLGSGLKRLGDSKAALRHWHCAARQRRCWCVCVSVCVYVWYRYRDAGWVKCQRAVACPLHLHPALALTLLMLHTLGLSLACLAV